MKGTLQLSDQQAPKRTKYESPSACTSVSAADCCIGHGAEVGAAYTKSVEDSPVCREPPSFNTEGEFPGSTIARNCDYLDTTGQAACVPANDSENGDGASFVTVMVPTEFTTAAGRPICIRRRCPIARGSAYWRFLFQCPLVEVVPHFEDTGPTNDAAGADEESGPSLPFWSRRLREHDVFAEVGPHGVRSRSCPVDVSRLASELNPSAHDFRAWQ
ncbi:hypothetical protein ERJ75_000252400 [Trypanosoma vivax]|nr:hypothetical protein TRVL_05042 [Trypanosoma vivax]KAH8618699.1 hypothetical protein ERJ75_000252400 [Trypanosoma vivax]